LTLDRGPFLWQVYCDNNKWQDVDPDWSDSIHDALAKGLPSIRVRTVDDDDQTLWFTIDLSEPTWITCTKEGPPNAKAKAKQLRAFQLKNPRVVTPA
jgi:hypothetical protein